MPIIAQHLTVDTKPIRAEIVALAAGLGLYVAATYRPDNPYPVLSWEDEEIGQVLWINTAHECFEWAAWRLLERFLVVEDYRPLLVPAPDRSARQAAIETEGFEALWSMVMPLVVHGN